MKPRLLVLELWGLGDLMIATPFIRVAAEKYAITLLAKSIAGDLQARFWPGVEVMPFAAPWTAFRHKYKIWQWPWEEFSRLRQDLTTRCFDVAVSARWDPRDHLVLKLSGARERLGFPRLQSQRYLTRPLPRPAPLAHRYDAWAALGSELGLSLPPRSDLFVTKAMRSPVVVIHTGARLPLRVWPLDNFRELVMRLRRQHVTVQVLCDKDQQAWWQSRGESVVCPASVTQLMAQFDAGCAFIGNDSGPGHLAAACGLPTLTLFGPQLPEWFIPLHPASEAIEGRACPYKPCSDYCRFAEPFCLKDVTVEEAWPHVEAFVNRHLVPVDHSPRAG